MGALPGHLPLEFPTTIQKQSFYPGKLTTMMNSCYSSWPVSTVRRVADKTNKNKISQDKQFQWCGSNSKHARALTASSITGLLPAHRKKFGKPIYARTLLALTSPTLSDPQFCSLIKCIRTDSCVSIFLLAMMSLRVCKLLQSTPRHPCIDRQASLAAVSHNLKLIRPAAFEG